MYSPSHHGLPCCLQKSWVVENNSIRNRQNQNFFSFLHILVYTMSVTCLSHSFAVSLIPTPSFAVCAVEDCVVQNIVRCEELFGSLCGYFADHHWSLEVYLDSRTNNLVITLQHVAIYGVIIYCNYVMIPESTGLVSLYSMHCIFLYYTVWPNLEASSLEYRNNCIIMVTVKLSESS